MVFKKGHTSHHKGKTKENYEPLKIVSKKAKERHKKLKGTKEYEKRNRKTSNTVTKLWKEGVYKNRNGCFKKDHKPWNIGKTKETDEKVRKQEEKRHQTFIKKNIYKTNGPKISKSNTGKISEKKGKKLEELYNKKKAKEIRKNQRLSKIRYIEEQHNNGLPIHPTIGLNETQILDEMELSNNIKILRQQKIYGYFVDGYIPKLNLCIEIDEKAHQKRLQEDKQRQKEIEELGCSFVRIGDNFK